MKKRPVRGPALLALAALLAVADARDAVAAPAYGIFLLDTVSGELQRIDLGWLPGSCAPSWTDRPAEFQSDGRRAAPQPPPGRPSRPTPRPAAASASAATLIAAMATAKAYR